MIYILVHPQVFTRLPFPSGDSSKYIDELLTNKNFKKSDIILHNQWDCKRIENSKM